MWHNLPCKESMRKSPEEILLFSIRSLKVQISNSKKEKVPDILCFLLKKGMFSISAKVPLAYFLSKLNFREMWKGWKFTLILTSVLFRSHVNNLLMSQMLFRADPEETPFVLDRYWDGALEIPLVPRWRFPPGAWGICPALATGSEKHNGALLYSSCSQFQLL